jgi:fumarate reductase subunit D
VLSVPLEITAMMASQSKVVVQGLTIRISKHYPFYGALHQIHHVLQENTLLQQLIPLVTSYANLALAKTTACTELAVME